MSTSTRNLRTSTAALHSHYYGEMNYEQAWKLQQAYVQQRADGCKDDELILLQHPSTYTAGKRTEDSDRPGEDIPVIDVDRGGKITWHGPGQLVGYPIIQLCPPLDVVEFVRRLENALISCCAEFGVDTFRVQDRSGVWCQPAGVSQPAKIASIGIRVSRGVTMHGFALNCNPDLRSFELITACGIPDLVTTSLSEQTGKNITVTDLLNVTCDRVHRALIGELDDHR